MPEQPEAIEAKPEDWFDDYAPEEDDTQVLEYDLTSVPNDFNVITIFNFIESGAVKIPGFQRNYVWDIKRASKLIESLIIGLPVPQLFLYEEARNRFLVIDGQQRLMSIYYFIKQRFPRTEKRVELRAIFDQHGGIPDPMLHDDAYFTKFNLQLPAKLPNQPNKFHGRNYATLDDYKTQLDLRAIRNVIVKQNTPPDDDSSIYEIFNRLNSGGINLQAQEIRASLYHSGFYDMLYRVNTSAAWRRVVGLPYPDLHMKDIEILLRGFALLVDGAKYAPSMTKFLNQFSKRCRAFSEGENGYLEALAKSFFESCRALPEDAFLSKRTRKFSIALFEAAFSAACEPPFSRRETVKAMLAADKLKALEEDEGFVSASRRDTTSKVNVSLRLALAQKHLA